MKRSATSQLVRLFSSSWETWETPAQPEEPARCISRSGEFPGSASPEGVFIIPARHVVSIPLWVDSEDPELIRTAITLQLEIRGLQSADVATIRTLAFAGRSLVVNALFPTDLAQHFPEADQHTFEASPEALKLPENAISLWEEGGDLVAAFTRGQETVYWVTFGKDEIGHIPGRLEALTLQLMATGILEIKPGRTMLESSLANHPLHGVLPEAQLSDFALPVLGSTRSGWQPAEIRESEKKNESRSRIRRAILAMAALYAGLASAAAIHLFSLGIREQKMGENLASLEAQVAVFHPIMQDWRAVAASVEPERYPLEVLRRLVERMPSDGLRLTSYDVADNVVTVEGEASSASLATEYYAAVSDDNGLAQIAWTMPTPTLLPSSVARFQITGAMP